MQAGFKVIGQGRKTTDKLLNPVYKGFPRLELSYRAAGDKDFGIHPFVGLSPRPDIGAMLNLSCGTYSPFRTRFSYDGHIYAGISS